jgi:diacylglycerol kinase family enzyme
MDAGRISGEQNTHLRYFGNWVGIGFDTVVSRLAYWARLTGFLSYLIAALKTMYINYQAPEIQIKLSNETIRQRSLMDAVMNGRRAGGEFHMAPHGSSSDGLFDLCIAKNISKAGTLFR